MSSSNLSTSASLPADKSTPTHSLNSALDVQPASLDVSSSSLNTSASLPADNSHSSSSYSALDAQPAPLDTYFSNLSTSASLPADNSTTTHSPGSSSACETTPTPQNVTPPNSTINARKAVEESLLPVVNEAKETPQQKPREVAVDEASRERLININLKDISRIAHDLFQDPMELERQQLRWAQGETIDPVWSEGLVKQQAAIMEQIGKAKRAKFKADNSIPLSSSIGSNRSGPPRTSPEPSWSGYIPPATPQTPIGIIDDSFVIFPHNIPPDLSIAYWRSLNYPLRKPKMIASVMPSEW